MFFLYLEYLFKSKTKYNIHSPFVYELITKVIYSDDGKEMNEIESLRKKLLKDDTRIEVNDFGAGGNRKYKRSISSIARISSKNKKYCSLLYRIVKHFKPKNMIELGTSLGISAIYQSKANAEAKFITLEGSSEISDIALKNFNTCNCKNIELISGEFSETLPIALSKSEKTDYVFFDGNHKREPTLKYFDLCLTKAHDKSIFIFDDINWSDEMREAWKEIKRHSSVTVTADLFFMGIVFFDKNLSKQDFLIRF